MHEISLLFALNVSPQKIPKFPSMLFSVQKMQLDSLKNPPLKSNIKGGKNSRGIRVSSQDPDEMGTNQRPQQQQNYTPTSQHNQSNYQPHQQYVQKGQPQPPPTLGSQRKFNAQKVSTISQNYNEKTMLLSSDDEYQ